MMLSPLFQGAEAAEMRLPESFFSRGAGTVQHLHETARIAAYRYTLIAQIGHAIHQFGSHAAEIGRPLLALGIRPVLAGADHAHVLSRCYPHACPATSQRERARF